MALMEVIPFVPEVAIEGEIRVFVTLVEFAILLVSQEFYFLKSDAEKLQFELRTGLQQLLFASF